MAMRAGAAATAGAGAVGATVGGTNWQAYVGYAVDFIGGIANTLTAGLAGRLVGWIESGFSALASSLGYNLQFASLVDTSSAAYKLGEAAGQAAMFVLMLTPAGPALMAIQAAGMAFNAYDAYQRGDMSACLLDLGGAILSAVGAGEALEAADGAIGLELQEVETPALVESEGMTGLESEAGGMTEPLESGLANEPGAQLTEANPTAELPEEPIGDYQGNSEVNACEGDNGCFTAEMLIDCEAGRRPAYTIKEHDLIWSRSENDPSGSLELKEVQEVFRLMALVCNVHVAGQVIRATVEHPFFVVGKGWMPAKALKIGDILLTRSGLLVPVEGVANSGAVETVYNWRIADHHTYFVSADEWGVSIWAHNTCYLDKAVNQDAQLANGEIEYLDPETNELSSGSRSELAGDHVLSKEQIQ